MSGGGVFQAFSTELPNFDIETIITSYLLSCWSYDSQMLQENPAKACVEPIAPVDSRWHKGSNSHPSIAPRVVIFHRHGSSRSAAHQAEASWLQMGSVLGIEVAYSWLTSWWFQRFFIFTPTWGNDPIWLIFFKGVETTNQLIILSYVSSAGLAGLFES